MTKFPYETMPFRLEHKEGKQTKVCFFACKEHLEKYLTRAKLSPKDCKVEVMDGVYTISKSSPKRKTKGKLFSSIEDFFV